MKDVAKKIIPFDMRAETEHFNNVVNFINENFDYGIFRAKNGLFTPNLYDTIMYAGNKFFNYYSGKPSEFKIKISELLEDESYKIASGASTYATKRMQSKIKRAIEIFNV